MHLRIGCVTMKQNIICKWFLFSYILTCFRLHSYASRSCGVDDFDKSLAGDLTKVEQKLIETQDFMKVRGKVCCNRLQGWNLAHALWPVAS